MTGRKSGLAVAACLVSLGLIAGCPGTDFELLGDALSRLGTDLASEPAARDIIPDGSYGGDLFATVQVWYNGQKVEENSGETELTATFVNGALLNDADERLRIGDSMSGDLGPFQVTRTVTDIQVGHWACEISLDLNGRIDGIPTRGTEILSFWLNRDGTIDMEDTMELFARNTDTGDTVELDVDVWGTMCTCRTDASDPGSGSSGSPQQPSGGSGATGGSGSAGGPGSTGGPGTSSGSSSSGGGIWHPSNPIFDLKSGKPKRHDGK